VAQAVGTGPALRFAGCTWETVSNAFIVSDIEQIQRNCGCSILIGVADFDAPMSNDDHTKLEDAVRRRRGRPRKDDFSKLVAWRYLSLFNFTLKEALGLVEAGYFSPTKAMTAGATRVRPMRMDSQR
jgi:hypothetical protein